MPYSGKLASKESYSRAGRAVKIRALFAAVLQTLAEAKQTRPMIARSAQLFFTIKHLLIIGGRGHQFSLKDSLLSAL